MSEKNTITYADCWSPSERKMKGFFENIKSILFKPLVFVLIKLQISANFVSYLSAIVGLIAVLYMWYDIKLATIFLILSLILDGLDGSLARATKTNNLNGSLTDCFTDLIVISASSIGLIATGLVNPIIGGIYLVSYPLLITFSVLRNILNCPKKYVFRPRFIVYAIFIFYAFSSINILNIILAPISLILLFQVTTDFYFLKNASLKN